MAQSNSTPSSANAANAGVWQNVLPHRWLDAAFCWSAMMTMTFGGG
jgi:hypothetical protein